MPASVALKALKLRWCAERLENAEERIRASFNLKIYCKIHFYHHLLSIGSAPRGDVLLVQLKSVQWSAGDVSSAFLKKERDEKNAASA